MFGASPGDNEATDADIVTRLDPHPSGEIERLRGRRRCRCW
jgi:hypothetical protein